MKTIQLLVTVTIPDDYKDADEEYALDEVTEALNETQIMAYVELA